MNTTTREKPMSPETGAPGACKRSAWTRQFGHPAGALGWAVGHLMAAKNASMSRLTVELLNVQPDDRVLEIGFGPGTLIHMLAKQAANGFVAGIDVSALMVKQASRRNREFIKTDQRNVATPKQVAR